MAYRRPTVQELLATDEERANARTAAGAPGEGAAYGTGIGSILGGLAGAIPLLIPGAEELAPVTIPAGAAAGGALGGAVGGSIGNGAGGAADGKLTAAEALRQRKINALQLREQALASMLGTH